MSSSSSSSSSTLKTLLFDTLFSSQDDRAFVLASMGAMIVGERLDKHCMIVGDACSSKSSLLDLLGCMLGDIPFAFPPRDVYDDTINFLGFYSDSITNPIQRRVAGYLEPREGCSVQAIKETALRFKLSPTGSPLPRYMHRKCRETVTFTEWTKPMFLVMMRDDFLKTGPFPSFRAVHMKKVPDCKKDMLFCQKLCKEAPVVRMLALDAFARAKEQAK